MIKYILITILFSNILFCQQKNIGKYKIDITKTYTQEVLGKNIGYYVEF